MAPSAKVAKTAKGVKSNDLRMFFGPSGSQPKPIPAATLSQVSAKRVFISLVGQSHLFVLESPRRRRVDLVKVKSILILESISLLHHSIGFFCGQMRRGMCWVHPLPGSSTEILLEARRILHRCLLNLDSFYQWSILTHSKKREGNNNNGGWR